MDYKEVKGENEESESQINNIVSPADVNNNNNVINVISTNNATNNNNITNVINTSSAINNSSNVESVNTTQPQDQIESQNVTIENVNIENGGSVYIICQNDSSTISASSSALIVNIGQNQVSPAGTQCNNTSCLQTRVNQVVLPTVPATATTTTITTTTSVRTSVRVPVRRPIRWSRRRGHQRLQTSPELMNFQIPVGGSIRYWNLSPQVDDGVNLNLPHERNAPPTYSPMMANTCPYDIHCSSFISPMPPPTYAQAVGAIDMDVSEDPFLELRVSTLWNHDRQPAYCFVCRVMIVTIVKHRISRFTHISVLILCFFGCWPCCLFPYCLNYFKTTYHYCPRCSTCLGVYSAFTN